MEELIDVGIIGGGPAGLSAALVLGRARKTVVVIDEGTPRNGVTRESHGFLSRDGVSPFELRRIAREQIAAYPTVRFAEDRAVGAGGRSGDFRLTTRSGETYRCRKLLFATGMKDLPLDIEGLTDVYGRSAFVCPYCDGWELRDKPLVLIVRGHRAIHLATTVAGWTDRIAVCTNGPDELDEMQREAFRLRNIPLYDAPIARIASRDGIAERVVLADGTEIACEGLFFAPLLGPGTDLPRALGCDVTELGIMRVDAFGKSNVRGVFGAGDAATEFFQIATAASMGAMAGVGINGELLAEAWERGGGAGSRI